MDEPLENLTPLERVSQVSQSKTGTGTDAPTGQPRDTKGFFEQLGESFGAAAENSAEYGIIQGAYENFSLRQMGVSGFALPGARSAEETGLSQYSEILKDTLPDVTSYEAYKQRQFTKQEMKDYMGLDEKVIPSWAETLNGAQIDTITQRELRRQQNAEIADRAWAQGGWGNQAAIMMGNIVGGGAVDTLATAGIGAAAGAVAKTAQAARIAQAFNGTKVYSGANKLYSSIYKRPPTMWRGAAIGAAENLALEAATMPLQQASNLDRGLEFTEQDIALQLGLAGGIGGVVGGAVGKVLQNRAGISPATKFSEIAESASMDASARGVDTTPEELFQSLTETVPDVDTLDTLIRAKTPGTPNTPELEKGLSVLTQPERAVFDSAPSEKGNAVAQQLVEAVDAVEDIFARPEGSAPPPRVYEVPDPHQGLPPFVTENKPIRYKNEDVSFHSDLDRALYELGQRPGEIVNPTRKRFRDLLSEVGPRFDLEPEELQKLAKQVRKTITKQLKAGTREFDSVFVQAMEEVLPQPTSLADVLPEASMTKAQAHLASAIDLAVESLDDPTSQIGVRLQQARNIPDLEAQVAELKKLKQEGLLPDVESPRRAEVRQADDIKRWEDTRQDLLAKLEKAKAKQQQVNTRNANLPEGATPWSTKKVDDALAAAQQELDAHLAAAPDEGAITTLQGSFTEADLNAAGVELAEVAGFSGELAARTVAYSLFQRIGALKKLVSQSDLDAPIPEASLSKTYAQKLEAARQRDAKATTADFIAEETLVLRDDLEQLRGLPWLSEDIAGSNTLKKSLDDAMQALDDLETRAKIDSDTYADAIQCIISNAAGLSFDD